MPTTRHLQRGEWKDYFATFTRRFFEDANPEAATIEVLTPALGDQVAAGRARARGVIYDPKDNALEVMLEGLEHLVYHPKEVWVVEEENGFVSTIEVVRGDGSEELIRFRSVGVAPKRLA